MTPAGPPGTTSSSATTWVAMRKSPTDAAGNCTGHDEGPKAWGSQENSHDARVRQGAECPLRVIHAPICDGGDGCVRKHGGAGNSRELSDGRPDVEQRSRRDRESHRDQ